MSMIYNDYFSFYVVQNKCILYMLDIYIYILRYTYTCKQLCIGIYVYMLCLQHKLLLLFDHYQHTIYGMQINSQRVKLCPKF